MTDFTNNHATQQFLRALTGGFESMAAIGEHATTPQQALHEAIDAANKAFGALPLPSNNNALRSAAAAAHKSHIELLRTLANFDADNAASRTVYDRRVRRAQRVATKARDQLLFNVESVGRQTTADIKRRELVELVELVFGQQDNQSTWTRGDIAAVTARHDSHEALFDKVNEHFADQAKSLEDARERTETPEQLPTPTLEPVVDQEHVGSAIVLDKLTQRQSDKAGDTFRREMVGLMGPQRMRMSSAGITLPLAISAAKIRAHSAYAGTSISRAGPEETLFPIVRRGEDRNELNADSVVWRRLLSTFYSTLTRLKSLPWILLYGEEEVFRQQKRIVMQNRVNELRQRLNELRDAESSAVGTVGRVHRRVEMVQQQLKDDRWRGTLESYYANYHVQLLSLLTAADREQALNTFRSSNGDAKYIEQHTLDMRGELKRLNDRMALEDAETANLYLSDQQKRDGARAEITDRIYESASGAKARLEKMRTLAGITFILDGDSVRIGGEEMVSLPTGNEPRREEVELRRISAAAAPAANLGLNVLADPELDDGAVWRIGFRGSLSPDLVEMYFGSIERISVADRIARLPLLRAYVNSVGAINRSSLRGFSDVATMYYEENAEPFETLVDKRLTTRIDESLTSLVLRLLLFSVDNDVARADAVLKQHDPSVLAKVPYPSAGGNGLHEQALAAIDAIITLFRSETLSTLYTIGDSFSLLDYTGLNGTDSSLTIGQIQVAPDSDLSDEQRERLQRSIAAAGVDLLEESNARAANGTLVRAAAAHETDALNRAVISVDQSMRQFTVLDFGASRRAFTDASADTRQQRAYNASQLVYVGHRVPARIFDAELGNLIADIQFQANTTDESVTNVDAVERLLASADCRIMRTFTRYDIPNELTGRSTLYVDDVYRYALASEAQRLQIVDVFDQSRVTLTLRDPQTDAVVARVLDRVVFGARPDALTDAAHLMANISNATASAAGQPLLALVAALFVRARLNGAQASAASNIGVDDETSMLERLLELPRRGYSSFKSLYDVVMAFAHESNFSSQALLALSIAFANINYLVLLFGVGQALWPAFVCVLRAIGFIDAVAKLMFDALFLAARKIGMGISWTLVGQLLNIFERMSWRHTFAGARRRELLLLRHYIAEMTSRGAALTPFDYIPGVAGNQRFIDRLHTFVRVYGSPARSGLARRTFDQMTAELFSPLYALLVKIPQAINGVVATAAWIVSGESVTRSPFSVVVLGGLNIFATVLFVQTLPACHNVWLSFFKVLVTNVITRAAWRKTFDTILGYFPRGEGNTATDRVVRTGRFALTAVSIIGPDLTSFVTGREFVITDVLQASANAAFDRLRGLQPSEFPRHAAGDALTSSSVLRFIDRPQQAVDSYVAFAGRFAGRTLWSVLRTAWEAYRMATFSRRATKAAKRTAVSPRTPLADEDEELAYMDDFDRYEQLDTESSRVALQQAFFRRASERDLWFDLLLSILDYNDSQLSIAIDGDFIHAERAQHYYPTRPEAFKVGRNCLTLIFRLHDVAFGTVIYARATFVLEYEAATKQAAVEGFQALMERNTAISQSVGNDLLDAQQGEIIENFGDVQELLVDVVEQPAGRQLWTAWRTFTVDIIRYREFPALLDRLVRSLAGVRLTQISLRTLSDLGDDGKYFFIEKLLRRFQEVGDREFIELLADVNIEQFSEESLGFGG
jgi:hypothetical protein